MKNKRIVFVDFLKAFSILMVVFCHLVLIEEESIIGNLLMLVCWSAVPCFMMASGYVLLPKEAGLKEDLFRAGRFYLALVVWKGLYLLFNVLFTGVKEQAGDILSYLLFFGRLESVADEHFWFLSAYMAMLLLLPLFRPMFRDRKLSLCVFALVLSYLSNQFISSATLAADVLGRPDIRFLPIKDMMPLGGTYSSMLPCFLLGGVFFLLGEKISSRRGWAAAAGSVMVILSLAVLAGIKYLQTGSFAWQDTYLVNGYGWTATVVMAAGWFILFANAGEGKIARFFAAFLGKNTMGIYYLHYLVLLVLSRFVYPMLGGGNLALNMLKTVLVTALCAMLTMGMKKLPLIKHLV